MLLLYPGIYGGSSVDLRTSSDDLAQCLSYVPPTSPVGPKDAPDDAAVFPPVPLRGGRLPTRPFESDRGTYYPEPTPPSVETERVDVTVKRAIIFGAYMIAYPVAIVRLARQIQRGEFPPPSCNHS